MNRRDTVLALLALGVGPLPVKAQQLAKSARVAYLGFGEPESAMYLVNAFKQGMRDLGYIEGRNVVFEVRWAFGKTERLPDLAQELVSLNPDVIVTPGTLVAVEVKRATGTIPIVVINTSDPVGSGFAVSLARPGGNMTGTSYLGADSSSKLLELLLTAVPKLSRVAMLWNPASFTTEAYLQNLQRGAQSAKVKILVLEARTPAEIENVFARMILEKAGAVIVAPDNLYFFQKNQIAELALKNRMPSIFQFRGHVEVGGLMSYGQNQVVGWRHVATYVDKILKGAKPGDLPFEQSTTFELVINLKTAKALGLTIPRPLLARADEVIQ